MVWTILFAMMGIAAYLVWMRDSTGRNGALALYGAQLVFNFFWTLIFFNLQNYALAFFWLLALWLLILLTTLRFFKETPAAGMAHGTLSGVGCLCRVFERGGMAAERGIKKSLYVFRQRTAIFYIQAALGSLWAN